MWEIYNNGNYTVFLNTENGTKIRYNNSDVLICDRPESMDVKITNKCNHGCLFCHENSTSMGQEATYNILKEFAANVLPYTEIAVGGGNLMCNLEHTEFFLKELQKTKAISSITVQQQDFIEFYYVIKKWIEEKLVYGVGVSVDNPTNNLLHEYLQDCPNAVIHTIVGMYDENYFKPLMNKGYKILFLGFKSFRRGSKYYQAKEKFIQENTEWLNNNIVSLNKAFKVISFDNLALEQLNMKEKVSQKMWDTLYCGDDGCFTFYVDLVEQTYTLNSTTLERQSINGQTPVEMFKDIRSRYGNQH